MTSEQLVGDIYVFLKSEIAIRHSVIDAELAIGHTSQNFRVVYVGGTD